MTGLAYGICIAAVLMAGQALAVSTVLVAPLANNTGEPAHDELAQALTDLLMVLLAEDGRVAVVERWRLDAVLAEQALTVAALAEPATLIRVGELLGADRIVAGGLLQEQADNDGLVLRLAAQVWRNEGGQLIGTIDAAASPEELVTLALDAAHQLAASLQLELAALDPDHFEGHPLASLHYLRGLGYFHAGNYDRALMALFTTTGLDPRHERAALLRAQCYLALEEHDHASIELEAFIANDPAPALHEKADSLLAELHAKRTSLIGE